MVIKETEPFYNRQLFRPVLDDAHAQITCLSFTTRGGLLNPDHFRKLNHFVLLYVLNGEGLYRDASGVEYPIEPGSLCIIPPDMEHTFFTTTGEPWDEVHMYFHGSLFDEAYKNEYFGCPSIVQTLNPVKHWARRLVDVMELDIPTTKAVAHREASAFLSVLTDANYSAIHGDSLQGEWMSKAKQLLRTRPEIEINLKDVAQHLGMSYERFRKRFTEIANESPGRYRKNYIIEEAAQLLLGSTLTHREIAERLNFADEYHFSQRFKLVMGESPKSFRKRYRIQ